MKTKATDRRLPSASSHSGGNTHKRGLSPPLIVLSGVTAASFLLLAVFLIRHLISGWAPSRGNVDSLLRMGKYEEALAVVRSGKNKQPGAQRFVEEGRVWLALAWRRMNRERWSSYGTNEDDWLAVPEADRAEDALNQALEMDPDNTEALYHRGMLYFEKGWFSAAESDFSAVLKSDREHVRARVNLGALYARRNRLQLARKELLRAYRIDPDHPLVLKNLAFLYRFYLDQPDSAMLWANRYLNTEPRNDWDINVVKDEIERMLERYPEHRPEEPMHWREPKRFKPRR
ncbi:MAG: tetratricopeptide repeat protein [Chitinivibrionales bacterium]|nr:tetratricopeptide repeat protein [Chitinivibrionales bacterium]MBD3358262.1 tetratricopeptide repeat protein [Chitinivibrionales bacterium]